MQQAALFSRERQFVEISVVLGFVCVNLREILGFLLCRLIEYSYVNILPQIAQITQRNAASCIISQRKTVCSLSGFGVSSAIISEICGRFIGVLCAII